MRRMHGFAWPLAVAVSAGCAGATVPAKEVSEAKAAIRAAEEVGAENHPEAALHLKMARDELKKADQWLEEDEAERALMALDRAEIDAELALATSRAADMRWRAQQAYDRVQELRQKGEQRQRGSGAGVTTTVDIGGE